DPTLNRVVGLGGAHQPLQPNNTAARDSTASVSSPWCPDVIPANLVGRMTKGWVADECDFRGERPRDHDPIAVPLLLEFQVYPDGQINGVASGSNQFHIGFIGPFPTSPTLGNGYYNSVTPPACGVDWQQLRAYTIGGFDPQKNQDVFVNPDENYTALGGWIK